MNVKKTEEFKENRPENYHVHDTLTLKLDRLSITVEVSPSIRIPLELPRSTPG